MPQNLEDKDAASAEPKVELPAEDDVFTIQAALPALSDVPPELKKVIVLFFDNTADDLNFGRIAKSFRNSSQPKLEKNQSQQAWLYYLSTSIKEPRELLDAIHADSEPMTQLAAIDKFMSAITAARLNHHLPNQFWMWWQQQILSHLYLQILSNDNVAAKNAFEQMKAWLDLLKLNNPASLTSSNVWFFDNLNETNLITTEKMLSFINQKSRFSTESERLNLLVRICESWSFQYAHAVAQAYFANKPLTHIDGQFKESVMTAQSKEVLLVLIRKLMLLKKYPQLSIDIVIERFDPSNPTAINELFALCNNESTPYFTLIVSLLSITPYLNFNREDGSNLLMYAAYNGHTESVSAILAAGSRVNATNNNGLTALMYAAGRGYDIVVKLLLAAGARPNIKNHNNLTALDFAASNGRTAALNTLLNWGGVEDKEKALHEAVREKHEPCMISLLAAGASVQNLSSNWLIDHCRKIDQTDSFISAFNLLQNLQFDEELDIAQSILVKTLAERALYQHKIKYDKSRLDTCFTIPEIFNYLNTFIPADSPVPIKLPKNMILAKNTGLRVLTYLTNLMSVEDIERLIRDYAQKNFPEISSVFFDATESELIIEKKLYLQCLLRRACLIHAFPTFTTLIEEVEDPDGAPTSNEQLPAYVFFDLCANKQTSPSLNPLIKLLAENIPVSPCLFDYLHLAAMNGHIEATKALLATNVDVNARGYNDFDGFCKATPLMLAASQGHTEVVRLLLNAGADVHLRDKKFERTALLIATMCRHPEVMQLLIEAGSDLDAVDTFGQALLISVTYRAAEVVETLIAAGSKFIEDFPYSVNSESLSDIHKDHKASFLILVAKKIDATKSPREAHEMLKSLSNKLWRTHPFFSLRTSQLKKTRIFTALYERMLRKFEIAFNALALKQHRNQNLLIQFVETLVVEQEKPVQAKPADSHALNAGKTLVLSSASSTTRPTAEASSTLSQDNNVGRSQSRTSSI